MIQREHTQVFYGIKGSGKSELCRAYWVSQAPWRVVIDVKDDLGDKLPGVPTVESPREILHYPTVRVVPSKPNDRAFYEEIYDVAFQAGDCLLWCDELNEMTHPGYIPDNQRRYILQGRTRRLGHLGCTPRPADIHGTFGSQADHIFVFRVQHPRDRDAIAGLIGAKPVELNAHLDQLPKYHFIYRDEENDIHICAPSHDPDELTRKLRSRHFGPAV